jgi:hypothetical protein
MPFLLTSPSGVWLEKTLNRPVVYLGEWTPYAISLVLRDGLYDTLDPDCQRLVDATRPDCW